MEIFLVSLVFIHCCGLADKLIQKKVRNTFLSWLLILFRIKFWIYSNWIHFLKAREFKTFQVNIKKNKNYFQDTRVEKIIISLYLNHVNVNINSIKISSFFQFSLNFNFWISLYKYLRSMVMHQWLYFLSCQFFLSILMIFHLI